MRPTTTAPKKRKKPVATASLTKNYLVERGWIIDKCEQRLPIPAIDKRTGKPNPFANVTRDLFEMFDFIGINPALEHGYRVVGIQVTSHAHHAERRTKILSNPIHKLWKLAGCHILLHSWGKTGPRGEPKEMTLREEFL